MHGHADDLFFEGISGFLGTYYLLIALMNAGMAYMDWQSGKAKLFFKLGPLSITSSVAWLTLAMIALMFSPVAYTGDKNWMYFITLPKFLRNLIDSLMNPTFYTLGSIVGFSFLFYFRKFFSKPIVAY